MTKKEFITELRKKLSKLPSREADERLTFYSEMIDDRIEDGVSEEAAVASVGTPRDIAAQIISERRTQKKKEKTQNGKKLKPVEVVLLVLGSPLWIAFIAVGAAVVITIFAVVLTVNLTLWALELPFFLFSLLSHYLLAACKMTTKVSILLFKKVVSWIKAFFIGKEKSRR